FKILWYFFPFSATSILATEGIPKKAANSKIRIQMSILSIKVSRCFPAIVA
ncbi:unnamed protein product, partial [Larinioides sclopetarius]